MGIFWIFLCTLFNTPSSAAPSDSTVSEDAGIEPRTVATVALTARRSNLSARSHPPSLTTAKKVWTSFNIFFWPPPPWKGGRPVRYLPIRNMEHGTPSTAKPNIYHIQHNYWKSTVYWTHIHAFINSFFAHSVDLSFSDIFNGKHSSESASIKGIVSPDEYFFKGILVHEQVIYKYF